MNYVMQCRFSEFLIQLCIIKFFWSVPKSDYYVQKNCHYWVRAEISLTMNQGRL